MTEAKEDWGPWSSGNVVAFSFGSKSLSWSLWQNARYIVSVVPFQCDFGPCMHVVIRSKPGNPEPTWAHKQRIKDELVGRERVAVEVFPATKELVDQADAYHLWVLPEWFRLPFGVEGVEGC